MPLSETREKNIQLYKACKENDIISVQELLLDPKININFKHYKKQTLLHIAVRNNNIEMVKILLEDKRINPNYQDWCGYTPLHSACCRNVELVKLLLEHPLINVNIECNCGNTPISLSIDACNIYIIRELMAHPDIDLNKPDNAGLTPLIAAYDYEYYDIIDLLLSDNRVLLDCDIEDPTLRTYKNCKEAIDVQHTIVYDTLDKLLNDMY
jgi:ankyrin repeat protein